MSSKGYTNCPNDWALDKRIKNELGLLLIIIRFKCRTRLLLGIK